jgi:ketosteroid isomerase-like protein
MRSFLTACALALLAAPVAAAPGPAAADRAAIRAARLAQNAAIARHDVDAVASFWMDDVTICRGLGRQLAGKAAYRALFDADVPGAKDTIVYVRTPTAIEVGRQWPLAFETGTWAGHAGGAAGPAVIRGRYSAQWVKRAGLWLIRSEVFVALDAAGAGRDMHAEP